ncbi:MAG: GNAT family N-acetyltransferase [Candidatus Pristimantibacillus lignocellulolyticus]|uniref:GNAT family N-acetyltransferase n=1 Tax=Candidatus Pristimantibacillus lignocellulolyticus TaxID=2994561 RepID=A0A9J6ZIQ4_9BACL|nr:MAG: GNAT family N-acetyltransferase [Candidatus Pristimantibacillus lignocellulolyticus]
MSDIILRKLIVSDFEQSVNLASYSFQYPLSPEQIEERRDRFDSDLEDRYGVFEEDELCAQASLLHLNIHVGGKLMKMGGVAGVCTAPEQRRNGYVATIIEKLLQEMRSNGETISMLHPFSFAFYRKYGWETYIEYKRYEMNSEHLTSILRKERLRERIGKVSRVNNYDELLPVYECYAAKFNGMLQRDLDWWKKRIATRKTGFKAIYRSDEGKAEGYVLYNIINNVMTIHELVAVTANAENELWYFIAQHDSMLEVVKWTAPSDDTFTFRIDNPRLKQEIVPYFMARIVDFESFISLYPFVTADHSDTFTIEITDEYATWNAGVFKLHIETDGVAHVERLIEAEDIESDLKIDIGALTATLLNYQKLEALKKFGRISGNKAKVNRFQNRISEQTSYLSDFF